ncbi:MAG: acetyl-CoA carboxylase biotin carboxyl carrier protein subunit [Rhodothermia bacterium]|nr:acetyl-CoA carboxylase biotin carboxyl carrier protein subunit [Rhodothermia bacterium]
MAKTDRRFRVRINDQEVDLTLGEEYVEIEGRKTPYSLTEVSEGWYHLLLDKQSHSIHISDSVESGKESVAAVNGKPARVQVWTDRDLLLEQAGMSVGDDTTEKVVRAPMPGLVLETLVEAGGSVSRGDGLLVLEAMKMENEIRASTDGVVKAIHVSAGDAVTKNDVLVELE